MTELIKALRRTPYQTLGIVFTMSFSFFVLILFSTSILLLTQLVHFVQTQPQVTIYFLKTTPVSDMYKLREELLKTEKVREVNYVSSEEALRIYKELNKNEPLLLEIATKDALPSSLEVFTLKPEYLKDIAALAKKEPGVEEVAFQQDVIDSLIKVTNTIQWSAIVFLSAQFSVVFFVLFTTVTYKLMIRRDEIEIQRLLGATRYFVIRPFIKENLFLNAAAVILSISLFGGLYGLMREQLVQFLIGIPTLTLFSYGAFSFTVWPLNGYFFILLSFITFIVGYSIILISTFFAASKYIK